MVTVPASGVATLRITWDERFGVYAGNAEVVAVKPEDITNLGLPLLEEASYVLAAPLEVKVWYDVLTGQIRVLVRR